MVTRRPTIYRSKRPERWLRGNRVSSKGDTRTVKLGCEPSKEFIGNEIISSKYTVINFVPKNLFEQFRRIANFYFLCVALISLCIDSPVSPVTSILPLAFVVVVTAIKQGYEDYLRHKADREVNKAKITVIRNGLPSQIDAEKVRVGDLVKLVNDQDVPCDVVLLLSSIKDGKCFVTTANLDGETNLKTVLSPKSLRAIETPDQLLKLEATIECEKPTPDLYKFYGRIEFGIKASLMLRQSIQTNHERRLTASLNSTALNSREGSAYQSTADALNTFGDKAVHLENIEDAFDYNKQKHDRSSKDEAGEAQCQVCHGKGGNKESEEQKCQCDHKATFEVGSSSSDGDSRRDSTKEEEEKEEEDEDPLKKVEKNLKNLEQKLKETKSEENLVTSNGSTEWEKTASNGNLHHEEMSKMNSAPDLGNAPLHHISENVSSPMMLPKQTRSIMKHRKTESNASRVSFNIDPSILRHKNSWSFERKASLIIQRKSSLLSSRKPSMSTAEGGLADPLGADNLLLRGARIRNTEYIYGCAVYTGQDSKLALNSKITSNKFSSVEKSINKFLIFFLVLLLFEVIMCTTIKAVVETRADYEKMHSYMGPLGERNFSTFIQDFFSFFVLFNYIIPISLYVTIEMQKFLGTLFFEWDLQMYDEKCDQPALCNTSDLNEELGQIEYLFSDKTGTLTENNMEFRRCSINGLGYFERNGQLFKLPENGTESLDAKPVDFSYLDASIEKFLLCLVLCHTAQVQEEPDENGKLLYNASSPDEKALVEAMQSLGAIYTGDDDDLVVVEMFGEEKMFRKLELLEFTSDRKRMSIIVEDENGQIWLYCKGAENSVLSLVKHGPSEKTLEFVADFARRGLRTLVIGYKKMTQQEYNALAVEMQKARNTLSSNRETVVAECYKKVESDLTVLGATGVEDQLQEGVQETLESLRAAGLKVWILTGDKVETAVNISMSCGHMKPGTIKLELVGLKTSQACAKQLKLHKEKISIEPHSYFGLVVDGESLTILLKEHRDVFREVCCSCTAVICCRMSPLQKSEVVHLVKTSKEQPTTAAIGDGANDVAMIQEAHIGLGIMGKEGRQAVRCSDFAFAKFKYAKRAILVHGHWYYIRIAYLVLYFFYKNVTFITPQVYFYFASGFSIQSLYDSPYLFAYNLFFTSLPILIFGLGEQDYPAETLERNPQLYKDISRNRLMAWSEFFKWNLFGLWNSVVIFGATTWFCWINTSFLNFGRDSDLLTFGGLIYHCVIFVVNLKLCLQSRRLSGAFVGSILISVIGYMAVAAIYSVIYFPSKDTSYYMAYVKLLQSLNFWLLSILIVMMCLLPDFVYLTVSRNWTEWKRNLKKAKHKSVHLNQNSETTKV